MEDGRTTLHDEAHYKHEKRLNKGRRQVAAAMSHKRLAVTLTQIIFVCYPTKGLANHNEGQFIP